MVAEGVKTAVTAHDLAEQYGVDMPVHEEIYRVVDRRRRRRRRLPRPAPGQSPATSGPGLSP